MSVLHEIAEVIGAAAAVRLGQAMGGARVYVPQTLKPDHPLVLILGRETAEKLSYYYGGDTFDVPSKVLYRHVRDALIRDAYHSMPPGEGNRADILAREYGISRRHVMNIVRG
ncbi:Mor transcription activator family protein [Grimontia sp. SpTr1]|uniref:Mor transcription activator family protein n=1 Tax=Grimontia sp. SpTr1 TaxID=2995319 RepID=UPI00248BD1AF|nr:Mor transcription activator family protein [Grimontia sp. SpTr1]